MSNKIVPPPLIPWSHPRAYYLQHIGKDLAEPCYIEKVVPIMSSDAIIHEIRTWSSSLESRMDAQCRKLDAQSDKIDALDAKIESLRRMIGLLIALLTLLAILTFFAFVRNAAPVSDPCRDVVTTQESVQPEPSTGTPLVPPEETPNFFPNRAPAYSPGHGAPRDGHRGHPLKDLPV